MNEIPHPGFDKPEKYETFTTTNDLEEAAEKYLDKLFGKGKHQPFYKELFIVGAKWQAEQDKETIELAEDHAYLAGAVNEREKMLKEAVEGYVDKDFIVTEGPFYFIRSVNLDLPNGFKEGDKVRIIICKKED